MLGEVAREVEGTQGDHSAPNVKAMMRTVLPDFEEEGLGFPRFEHFLYTGEHRGIVRVDATVWPQQVYPTESETTRANERLFDRQDWGWLIACMKSMQGPRFESSIVEELRKAEVSAASEAQKFVVVAKKNGVLSPFRELRYNAAEKVWKPYSALQFNEQNPRVQVYLGLSAA